MCEGLAAAHQAGVAHRDLKPANVMIDRAGKAYLMDFGLARSVEATQYTMAGTVLGTIEYMSPEQANGEPADFRSDIYTMGIILFELFTGARPFKGDTPMSRLAARVNQKAPDPRVTHPDLPPYLSQIIVRCLEREPALRYQRVEEILADLDAHKATERPWRVVWRRRASWKLAVAAVVMLAVAAASVLVARRAMLAPAAPATSPAAGPTVTLAILPFRNASGDPTLAWLGTSLAGNAPDRCWTIGLPQSRLFQSARPDAQRPASLGGRRLRCRQPPSPERVHERGHTRLGTVSASWRADPN